MSFNVLRLKRELGRNAYLGLIGTGATVLRRADLGISRPDELRIRIQPSDLCPSGATVTPGSSCFHDAYLGGIDGFWRSESGNYMVAGQAVMSLIENGPPRWRSRPTARRHPASTPATTPPGAGCASPRRAASRSSGPPSTPTRGKSSTTTTSGSSCARTCTSSRPASVTARSRPGATPSTPIRSWSWTCAGISPASTSPTRSS